MSKIINIKHKYKKGFSKICDLLSKYDQDCVKTQGLAFKTRQLYCANIRCFLLSLFPSQKVALSTISPRRITDFILTYTREGSDHRAQAMVYSLRSFFKFLIRTGRHKKNLADAVPGVPVWKRRPLPVYLSRDELQQMLQSCNKSLAVGLRDYAILMLLITLGVRDSEVCKLRLDDIDWDKGEIIIRGKGSETRFPLFQDLGAALTDYLQHGRPKCSSNFLFTRVKPSQNTSRDAFQLCHVKHIVRDTLKRAGLNPEKKGTHLLRHSFATQLLKRGASLQEIGMILRHKHIVTTAIYASVDFNTLATVAQPWPRSCKKGV